VLLKLTNDTHKASLSLFVTAELLVSEIVIVTVFIIQNDSAQYHIAAEWTEHIFSGERWCIHLVPKVARVKGQRQRIWTHRSVCHGVTTFLWRLFLWIITLCIFLVLIIFGDRCWLLWLSVQMEIILYALESFPVSLAQRVYRIEIYSVKWWVACSASLLSGCISLHCVANMLLYCCLLVKFINHNQNLFPKTWRFDLYQRPSSEEAGTQFFWCLT